MVTRVLFLESFLLERFLLERFLFLESFLPRRKPPFLLRLDLVFRVLFLPRRKPPFVLRLVSVFFRLLFTLLLTRVLFRCFILLII